jgi:hypothetical protein
MSGFGTIGGPRSSAAEVAGLVAASWKAGEFSLMDLGIPMEIP